MLKVTFQNSKKRINHSINGVWTTGAWEKNKLHLYFTQYREINSMYIRDINFKLLKVLEENLLCKKTYTENIPVNLSKGRGLPSMGLHRAGHDWSDLAAGLLN